MAPMKAIRGWILQALKFGLVGAVNTLIDWGVFALLALAPFFADHYAAAKAVSYGCGVANSFFMNRRYTFRDRERMTPRRLAAFLLVNLAAWGVSVGVIALLRPAGLDLRLCNMAATAFSLAINFAGSKLLVFRSS